MHTLRNASDKPQVRNPTVTDIYICSLVESDPVIQTAVMLNVHISRSLLHCSIGQGPHLHLTTASKRVCFHPHITVNVITRGSV